MASTITEFAHLQIPLSEILKATNNFAGKNIIGKGEFGKVYKGKLMRNGESIKISARRLDRKRVLGDVEFLTEISVLSSFHDNSNIVSMIGFCDEQNEKIIINKHYKRGSLSRYISDPASLKWEQRLDIANELVYAIKDLHEIEGRSYIVIHRNINCSTILLDDDWKPKLSGFEFSIKQPVERRNQVFLGRALGTKGYKDPATEKTGGVTEKLDIYCLGVILFELLCGRKAYEENRLLAPLAKFHFEKGTLQDIIIPDLWNQAEPPSLAIFSKVAYSCLEDEPAKRPNWYHIRTELVIANWKPSDNVNAKDKEDEKDTLEISKIESSSTDVIHPKSFYSWKINIVNINIPDLAREKLHMRAAPGRATALFRAEIECLNNNYLSSIEGEDKYEPTIRSYKVTVEKIVYRDVELKEIETLSICRHPNIESFLGLSYINGYVYLFYKHVSLRFLDECLNDGTLTWEKRLKICIGVAQGLNYLHNEMEDQKTVIHRDINSENIELDDVLGAKIVGFYNSVFLPPNQDDDALHLNDIVGKRYYVDPEDAETGRLKRESDTFSFGIVLIEVLCGKRAEYLIENEGCDYYELAHLARGWFDKGIIKEKLAPTLNKEKYGNSCFLSKGPNKDSLDAFLRITYECLAPTQNQRPRMEVVVNELQTALSFQETHKDPLRMSFEDIKLATKNFSSDNKVGVGGFGSVYKGDMVHGHGNGYNTIVVKKLDTSHGQGEKQYYNELQILHEYRHENVIGLVGYSNETDEKLIVYEYAPKGSLDRYLSNASLTWRNRLMICIDVVTGIDFLHGGTHGKEVVVHRDIKTANILLFDDWRAKVGDFGLSLISTINEDTKFTIDHACGTMDYVDPLYLESGLLTRESDIYSIGVVLFEILYGRVIYAIDKDTSRSLLSFIKQNVKEGKTYEMVLKVIKEEIVLQSLGTFLNIVCKCLDNAREKRPTSKEVLVQLKKTFHIQVCDLAFCWDCVKIKLENEKTKFLEISLGSLLWKQKN
ncbi:uncharacterized protein [Rutidosis leptorrhynchoides]|uniref:uncharacterized protein n=1 Tax=Rutidosis leptorrhynchoides TaxID=125765 RepID=UPI003A99D5E7